MACFITPAPAPVTLTIRPGVGFRALLTLVESAFLVFVFWKQRIDVQWLIVMTSSVLTVIHLLRGEQVEIYPDEIVFRTGLLGFVRTRRVAAADVVGAVWSEATHEHEGGDRPSYIEFFLLDRSIKAARTIDFEDYMVFRKRVAELYPELERRWGSGSVRSKEFTLLNLS